jgi:hypothetical protein
LLWLAAAVLAVLLLTALLQVAEAVEDFYLLRVTL